MRKLLIISILFLSSIFNSALANNDVFYRAAAGFLYSFTNIIKDKSGSLCVYGYDQIAVFLEENYSNVIFFKNEIDLKKFSADKCRILYISKNVDRSSYMAIKYANRYNIVSISFYETFIEDGGTILVQPGRRNFELILNQQKVKEINVKFDPIISNLIVN